MFLFKFLLNIFNFFCLKLIVKFAKCFLLMFRDYRYVENYPGYIISNFGEVFSTKRGNVIQLKGTDDGNGYLRVTLKNKNHKIHVLVGEAFIGKRSNGKSYDHIDRNTKNNRVDNLRIATASIQCENRNVFKNNKLGVKNISLRTDKKDGWEYYRIRIQRNGKSLCEKRFAVTKYTIDDVIKIREDIIAKYNHEVLLNKVHTELSGVRYLVRSI